MAAGRPAENPELVLQADHIGTADVEEIRCPQIGGQVLFLDFEANFRRILVTALEVVNRHRKAVGPGLGSDHRRPEVGGEGGDAAFARQVTAKESDLPDLRGCVHKLKAWSTFAEKQSLSPGMCTLSRGSEVGLDLGKKLPRLPHAGGLEVGVGALNP